MAGETRDFSDLKTTLIKAKTLPFDLDYRMLEFAGDLDQFSLAARTSDLPRLPMSSVLAVTSATPNVRMMPSAWWRARMIRDIKS